MRFLPIYLWIAFLLNIKQVLFSSLKSNSKKESIKESLDILDFSKFKLKMNLPYNNLKEYSLGKKLEKNIEVKK